MITRAFPILSTRDLGRALGFYRDLLGGKVVYQFPEEGAAESAGYVSVALGESSIGVGLAPEAPEGPGRVSIWLYVDSVDDTVRTLRDSGVPILDEPTDQPWGERTARVADPDDNEVHLGAPAAAGPK